MTDLLHSDDLVSTLTTVCRGGHHVLLYGPPGTGKTRLATDITTALNPRAVHISLPEDTMVASLQGHRCPDQTGAWVWRDGPVEIAQESGRERAV